MIVFFCSQLMYLISVPPKAGICTAQPGGAKQKDEGRARY